MINLRELFEAMQGISPKLLAGKTGLSNGNIDNIKWRAKNSKSVSQASAELILAACKEIRASQVAPEPAPEQDAPAPIAEVQMEPIFVADEAAELPAPFFAEEFQAIRTVLNTQPVFLEEKRPELNARDPWTISFEICQLMHELKQCVGPQAAEQFLELASDQASSSQFRYAK